MSANKGLGRGIDSLIADNFDKSLISDNRERIQKLFISDLSPLKDQPRRHFDEQALNELASSIKQYGVLQPIIVSLSKDGKYTIIAGERRFRAAKIAKIESIPAIVRDQKKQEQLEIALIENVQRVDLSPLEQAQTIYSLHTDFNLSYEIIAKRLGKSAPAISNSIRLLQLPKNAFQALGENKISEGHARAILSLKEYPNYQDKLLNNIITNGWSVRQAEQYAIRIKKGDTKPAKTPSEQKITPGTAQLSKKLDTPVTIKRLARGGKLEIKFSSDQQLKSIIKKLI